MYAFLKHFALRKRTARMLATWTNEQACVIYLRSLRDRRQDGGARTIMSSFSYIGPEYAGANSALLNNACATSGAQWSSPITSRATAERRPDHVTAVT